MGKILITLVLLGLGGDAALRPAIVLKLGYIFEGFWSVKEK